MEKDIINKWDKNKERLKEYFSTTPQSEYSQEYLMIIKKVVELILNEDAEKDDDNYNLNNITTVDNGDYYGTLIFLIHKNSYNPSVEDYLYTSVCYGSCSACDTLQGISEYSDEIPTSKQVDEYMTLALHLIQNMKKLIKNEE